jgi:ABC-type Zn uptake system ZnuABC Zn-binding protein ZnuA
MKSQGVKVVICETYSDNKLAAFVAEQAGAKLLVLPDHVNGVKEADTYQNLFRFDVEQVLKAVKEQ